MRPELLLIVVAVAIPVVAILSALSTRYIRRLYYETPTPRSFLFRALVVSVICETAVGLYFSYAVTAGFLLLFDVAELPVFPRPWNMVVAGIAAIILLSPPIFFAVTIALFRRRSTEVYHPGKSDGDVG